MKMIVVITGAGWDPVTEAFTRREGFNIPARTPELFWSVSYDATVISRQAAQFKMLGAQRIFVGMGKPGCSPAITEDHDKKVYNVKLPNYGKSPWTQAQVDYIKQINCSPILIPDSHAKGENCWSTLLRMAPTLLEEPWDRIIISAGDYVFRTAFLQNIVETSTWPLQFWFFTKHSMELLTRDAFLAYTTFLRELPNHRQSTVWSQRANSGLTQTVWGTRKEVFGKMAEDWTEVDPHSWGMTLALVKGDPI